MDRRAIVRIFTTIALATSLPPASAIAEEKLARDQLLGTWNLVSHESVRPDGSRTPVYGVNPKGVAFFDPNGHFIITVMRADRAKYAIDFPTRGSAEENQATAQGTMTYFGTYSVNEADRTISIHIDASSFPNWNGAD